MRARSRKYQSSALPPPIAAPQSYPAAPAYPEEGAGVASYSPPSRQPIETTGSVAPRSIAATRAPGREAGTTIIVGTSDTHGSPVAPLRRDHR